MRAKKKFFVEVIESPFPKYGFPRMGPIGGSLDIRRPALEGPSVQRRMKQKRGRHGCASVSEPRITLLLGLKSTRRIDGPHKNEMTCQRKKQ